MKTQAKKQSIENLIKQNNLIWKSASRAERRLLVLKDMLKLIKYPQIDISKGVYTSMASEYDDVQTVYSQKDFLSCDTFKKCRCCFRGAALLSKIRLGNKAIISIDEHDPHGHNFKELSSLFNDGEICLMESIFEASDMVYATDTKSLIYKKLSKLAGDTYFDDFIEELVEKHYSVDNTKRLVKMCNNIIKHNGDVWQGLVGQYIDKKK